MGARQGRVSQHFLTHNHHLNVQVTRLQSRMDELQASGDVSAATVQSLEATLAAIERAETRRAGSSSSNGAARMMNAQATKRATNAAVVAEPGWPVGKEHQAHTTEVISHNNSSSGSGGSGNGSASAAVLSRELVKAHSAAADAQRKLRVSER